MIDKMKCKTINKLFLYYDRTLIQSCRDIFILSQANRFSDSHWSIMSSTAFFVNHRRLETLVSDHTSSAQTLNLSPCLSYSEGRSQATMSWEYRVSMEPSLREAVARAGRQSVRVSVRLPVGRSVGLSVCVDDYRVVQRIATLNFQLVMREAEFRCSAGRFSGPAFLLP